MIEAVEVLRYLRPDGGWYISGNEYDGIQFISCEPFSEEEFNAGFLAVEKAKSDAQNKREAALSKLAALGLTVDDLKALGLA